MEYTRREFMKKGGSFVAGLALADNFLRDNDTAKLDKFGIQLWTVKNALAKDPRGVLKQLSEDGYKQIESFEGTRGMFWGMSPSAFKKYVDGLGMTIVSSHCDDIYKDSFEKKAADAGSIGLKYLISPSESGAKTVDDFKKLAHRFNQCGEICKKHGLQFGYHNHDAILKPIDNQLPLDILLANTSPENVVYEMDIYWVVTGKQDPEEWLTKHKGRFRLCHIKDRIKGSTEEDASCILGEGSIDFHKILKTARANGMKYYIVEQERYDNSTEMDSAKADADYLKKFTF